MEIFEQNHDTRIHFRIFVSWLNVVIEWCFTYWSNQVDKGKGKTNGEYINYRVI